MTKAILAVLLISIPAAADSDATGDKGAHLARALKYAGVKPTTAKNVRTFQGNVDCWSSREGVDEQLGDYKCTVDKIQLPDGLAYLLDTAMEAAGVASTHNMSQSRVSARLTCTVEPPATARCSWGPADIVIKPKKLTPKDIVQPVKIEKQ